jgi:glucokinase
MMAVVAADRTTASAARAGASAERRSASTEQVGASAEQEADVAARRTVIGVDLGGTAIKAALYDVGSLVGSGDGYDRSDEGHAYDVGKAAEGDTAPQPLERLSRPTPPGKDPAAVLGAVTDVVAALRHRAAAHPVAERAAGHPANDAAAHPVAEDRVAEDRVVALGLAIPGIIDERRGMAVAAANIGWNQTPVRDLLAAETGLPVALGHDVRTACLAEWRLGAARESSRVLFVTLGTGIGAGVVSEGRLLVGGGYAGQLGHIVVDPDGAICGCGQRGCLATVSSASAVVRRYVDEAVRQGLREATAAPLSAREVAALARTGDPVATAVWCDAVAALARGLVSAATVYGSELVVLGGGLALAGDQLLVPVREAVLDGLTFLRRPRVVRATFADGSGVLGAALLARQLLA